jgi:hypothetical protein
LENIFYSVFSVITQGHNNFGYFSCNTCFGQYFDSCYM